MFSYFDCLIGHVDCDNKLLTYLRSYCSQVNYLQDNRPSARQLYKVKLKSITQSISILLVKLMAYLMV